MTESEQTILHEVLDGCGHILKGIALLVSAGKRLLASHDAVVVHLPTHVEVQERVSHG
jgi:hypothetical protein